MDRRKLRRLLASSSFAALLVASPQVRGQSVTNPAGSTIGFLRVTAGTVANVINFGVLTGGTETFGIAIEGEGAVSGDVRNEGTITLSGGSQFTGILVYGDGPSIGGQIANTGKIAIEVTGEDDLVGRGIAVEGTDFVVGGDPAVVNGSGASIDISLQGLDSSTNEGVAEVNGLASGIHIGAGGSYDGAVVNNGRIDVGITNIAKASRTGDDLALKAVAAGSAFGISVGGKDLAGGVQNTNLAGTATIEVGVDISAVAAVVASSAGEGAQGTAQVTVDAKALGLHIGISDDIESAVVHSGVIEVANDASARAKASADGSQTVEAKASATINMLADGVHIDAAALTTGGFQASGEILVSLEARAEAVAEADVEAGEAGSGSAAAVATQVDALARGVFLNIGTVVGGIANHAVIDVDAIATAAAKAVAAAASSNAEAGATASADLSVRATGISATGITLKDGFLNAGRIEAKALGKLSATASALGGRDPVADAAIGSPRVAALGVGVFYDSVSGDIVNSASVQAIATAEIDLRAVATGLGRVIVSANLDSAAVTAVAAHYSVSVADGDLRNSGKLTAAAVFSGKAFAKASVTGAASGTADLRGALRVNTVHAVGLDVRVGELEGAFENSGAILAEALAKVTGTYAARNLGTGSAFAMPKGGIALAIDATATGLTLAGGTFGAGILNTGSIEASAAVQAKLDIDAQAKDNAVGADGAVFADVFVVGIEVDHIATVVGDLVNKGQIDADAIMVVSADVKAVTSGSASAVAEITGNAFVVAKGASLNLTKVEGTVSNTAPIRVDIRGATDLAPAQVILKATAEAPSGTASAHATLTDWHVTGSGLDVRIETVGGKIVNAGTVAVVAAFSAQVVAKAAAESIASATASAAEFGARFAGIRVAVTAAEGFDNSGDVAVLADLKAKVTASATASTSLAFADANFAIDGTQALLSAIGVDVAGQFGEGGIGNQGAIDVTADWDLSLNAHASGKRDAEAFATAKNLQILAVGLRVNAGTVSGGFTNSGEIAVTAALDLDAKAAVGTGEEGALARGLAAVLIDPLVEATGFSVTGSSLAGSFENLAGVKALASVALDAHATASVTGGHPAKAAVDLLGQAKAVGGEVLYNTIAGGVTNRGKIDAAAVVNLTGSALALNADGSARAELTLNGSASAKGLVIAPDTLGGAILNAGSITATAQAKLAGNAIASGLFIGRFGALPNAAMATINMTSPVVSATGILMDLSKLSDPITNEGQVKALASLSVAALADASVAARSSANAAVKVSSAFVQAQGIDIRIDAGNSLGGNILNSGAILARALAAAQVSALAGGGESKSAAGAAITVGLSVAALGLDATLFGATMTGDFTNEGAIQAIGQARIQAGTADAPVPVAVSALGVTIASAEALVGAYATAHGIRYDAQEHNGDLVNKGEVKAGASIALAVDVKASAAAVTTTTITAQARAELSFSGTAAAFGIRYAVQSMVGDVTNTAKVTALAAAHLGAEDLAKNITATVLARGVTATASLILADNEIGFGASATGIVLQLATLDGAIDNQGNVEARALADVKYKLQANAVVGANAQATALSFHAVARGLAVDAPGADSVTNSGALTVLARVDVGLDLQATGNVPDASLEIASLSVSALGLDIQMDSLAGPLANSGKITVEAAAAIAGTAAARVTSTAGAAAAAAVTYGLHVAAKGIDASLASLGGNFTNEGGIVAWAHMTLAARATALGDDKIGKGKTGASAAISMSNVVASATGIGIVVTQAYTGTMANRGEVKALASIAMDLSLQAAAKDSAVRATLQNEAMRATALGFGAFANGGIDGNLENSGDVTAQAAIRGEGSVLASVLPNGNNVRASAFHSLQAAARGVDLAWAGLHEGSSLNSGDILAAAVIELQGGTADAPTAFQVSALSGFVLHATQSAVLRATASGLRMTGAGTQVGALSNTGGVKAQAAVEAFLGAKADLGLGNADAAVVFQGISANARGVTLQAQSLSGNAGNAGAVTALAHIQAGQATASGAPSATIFAGGKSAEARLGVPSTPAGGFGFRASAAGVQFAINTVIGDLSNSGGVDARALIDLHYKLEAEGSTAAVVRATSNLFFSAQADALRLSDLFFVDGDLVNEGDLLAVAAVSIGLSAFARLDRTPGGTGGAAATLALSEIRVEAAGLFAGADSVTGDISNSGDVTAQGRLDLSLHAEVGHLGTGSAPTSAAGAANASKAIQLDAQALLAQGFSLGGGFINSGSLKAFATADFDLAVDVSGTNGANAKLGLFPALVAAGGYDLRYETLGGSIVNSADVTAQAKATLELRAEALAAPASGAPTPGGLASALIGTASGAALSVLATGAFLSGPGTVGGSVTNSGDVTARAILNAAGEAGGIAVKATGSSGAVAKATLDNVQVAADGEAVFFGAISGSLSNEGSLDAAAILAVDLSAAASAKTRASVALNFGARVSADGLTAGVTTIVGGFANSGAVDAVASADIGFVLNAAAAEAVGAAKVAALSVLATGLQLSGDSLAGGFRNASTVEARALANLALAAVARSASTATLRATFSNIDARAQGVLLEMAQIEGGFDNEGSVVAAAFLGVGFDPEEGDARDAFVRAASEAGGNLSANASFLLRSLAVLATGIGLDSDTLSGGFVNSGAVQASARMVLDADAVASGSVLANADLSAKFLAVTAVGLKLDNLLLVEDGLHNEGKVNAAASLTAELGVNVAFGGGEASALLSAMDLTAIGFAVEGNGATGQVLEGGFANGTAGEIGVQARGKLSLEAFAEAGTAGALVLLTNAMAKATGMGAFGIETLNGGYSNDGDIVVLAQMSVAGRASAQNADTESIAAFGAAAAFGMRIEPADSTVPNNILAGGMANRGLIMVSALASVDVAAGSDGGADGKATASARAFAIGMRLNVGTLIGDLSNSGRIVVRAAADAEAVAVTATERAQALAYGILAFAVSAEAGVINSGTITVAATANAPALAVGQAIGAGLWTGALENAGNGAIRVVANDPLKATAVGLKVEAGAQVLGGVENAGLVVARAISVNSPVARAIDVTTHTASGLNIRMVDGTLEAFVLATANATLANNGTAVAMQVNAVSDTLDWSGGLVLADIVGTSLDRMNVFAGKAATMTFNDEIRGVGEINVNTPAQAAAPVLFRMNGKVSEAGLLNVNEGGTLRVGVEAEIGVDTYDQDAGGTLVFDILPDPNPGNGVITVANIARLDGTIGIVAQPGLYADTQTYLLIKGELEGVFAQTPDFDNSPLLSFAVEQENPDVTLVVRRTPFDEVPGLTHNQKALGEVLEDLYDPLGLPDEPPGVGPIIAQLFGLTTNQYYDALDDLHGAEHAQMAYAGFQAMEFLLGGVNQRLNDGRSAGGPSAQSAGVVEALQYAAAGAADGGLQGTQMAAIGGYDPDRPASIWGKGFGAFGTVDGDAEAPGYDRTTGAAVLGLDYRIDEAFLVGLAASYAFSSIDFDDGDQGDLNSFQIGLFGSWDSGTWYVDGLASYAFQSYETERHIDFGMIEEKATADYDGSAVQVYGELGYQFRLGQQFQLQPLIGLGWTSVWTDDYEEEGASGANLRVDEARFDSLATTLGVRGSLALDGFEPSLFLGWRHEFLDDHGEADVAFAAVPDSKWTVIGSDIGSDAGLVGMGIIAEISAQLEATIDYGGQFSGSGSSHTGSIGLRLKF